MGQIHFARMPGITYPRSKFKMPFKHNTSFNHGELVPIDCFPVIPGDTFSLKLSSLIRMSTPIAPIMDDITCHVQAFFVPMRLIWEHTEEFFGENKTSAGPQTTVYKIPNNIMNGANLGNVGDSSLSAYLGKPVKVNGVNAAASVLKERGYYLIHNEWFRAQQVQNPVIIDKSGNGAGASIGTLNGIALTFNSSLLKVNKDFDYFTTATIQPQYGPSVTLPLGTYAPVIISQTQGGSANANSNWDIKNATAMSAVGNTSALYAAPNGLSKFGDIVADLSNATAATINSIRYAFAVQKYLERCNFGTRYFEILKAHYGVTSPDARLQRPELLGETRFSININQVTSVAGYAAGTSTEVGETGAVSVTTNSTSLFTKGFVEFGYVYVMLSTVQDQSYSQGLMREDFLFDRFDFYSPEFANLGDQEIKNKEIVLMGGNDEVTWGYQEHWAELRYRPNRNTGKLNPMASGALDYWTLGNKFVSSGGSEVRPLLGATFLEESRDNITRCLKTGSSGPDYIASFYFDYTATREIPLYSIPGLVDHVGNM